MINVYISAPSELRGRARWMRNSLKLSGINVISRWLDEPDGEFKNVPDDKSQAGPLALKNLEDINQCGVLIAINPEEYRHKGSGGRHVELGFALAHELGIVIYGERTGIFHYLPGILHVEEPGDFIKATRKLIDERS